MKSNGRTVTRSVLADVEVLRIAAEMSAPNFTLSRRLFSYVLLYDWYDHVVEVGSKAELRDVGDNVVVPAIYDDYILLPQYMYDYFDKTIKVTIAFQHGLMGLVLKDGKGTPVTEFVYDMMDYLFDTGEQIWFLARRAGATKKMIIDSNGDIIIPEIIDAFSELTCWLDYYRYKSNGKYGLMAGESSGTNVIPPIYDEIYSKGWGDFIVFVQNGRQGYVTLEDEGGHFFIPIEEYKNDKYVFFDGEQPYIAKRNDGNK